MERRASSFDPDYVDSCTAEGLKPERPSLHSLFTWVDVDKSGKVSRNELSAAIPLLEQLEGHSLRLSPAAWESIEEDGDGCINFNEFAQWAGPRLGLPLGVEHLFASRGSRLGDGHEPAKFACGIVGCPCQGYVQRVDSDSSSDEPTTVINEREAIKKKGSSSSESDKEEKDKEDKKSRLRSSSGSSSSDEATKMEKKERAKKAKKKRNRRLKKDNIESTDSSRTIDRMSLCMCGHKHKVHQMVGFSAACSEVPYPTYWVKQKPGVEVNDIVPLDVSVVPHFQKLFDDTHLMICTRDRGKLSPSQPNVPVRYIVQRVLRSENSRNWREYCVRRAELEKDRAETRDSEFVEYTVRSSDAWNNICEKGGSHLPDGKLSTICNEWYLFHGCTSEAVMSTCTNDFKISFAGGSTGIHYGRGTYFAESCTKADEYARSGESGEFAMLICRVLGGRVKYTDEVEPDPEDLVRSCIEGPYDSVLGDRERCRKTFREFVVFDTESIYAEYIVIYKREY